MRHCGRVALVLLFAAGLARADLTRVTAEANLEKRSRMALENAEQALNAARQAYDGNDLAKTQGSLEEVVASVNLALESLKQTGKNPTRSPKNFKYAEMKSRVILKKLAAFSDGMSAADREGAEKARESIQKVHDTLLQGIMEGWK
jgi:hypothetical protein